MRARITGFLLGLLLSLAPLQGSEAPRLLADVNRETAPGARQGEPSGFFELGGRLFFSTADPASLDQAILWSTDGTERGTVQVSARLCVALCDGILPLATWRGVTFLRVTIRSDSIFPEYRLARTDGTPEGTYPLTGLTSNSYHYDALSLRVLPGEGGAFFIACTGAFIGSCNLWKSDATRAGTTLFRGSDALPFFAPRSLTVWRGRLYFIASRTPQGDPGLWSTDGTAAGTRFVHEVRDLGEARPAPVVATPSHLFFAAGEIGEDLWVTDGTSEGSRLLADFPPPCDAGACETPDLDSIRASGDEVFFVTHRPGHRIEIWRSDGTEPGTRPAIELPARVFWADSPRRIGGHWFFRVENLSERVALWTLDDGFTRVAPLTGCPDGPCPEVYQDLFFSPTAGTWLIAGFSKRGDGLWSTDGTGPGTRRLADVCSPLDPSPGGPDLFPSPAGALYFRACPQGGSGDEIWITDGSPAGTHRVGGHVSGAGLLGGQVYFGSSSDDPPASELWTAGEAPDAARRVAVLRHYRPGSAPRFQPVRGGVVFAASQGNGRDRLWRSDGTPGGTVPLPAFPPDFQGSPGYFLALGSNSALFTVYRQKDDFDPKRRTEIWRTDGTAGGTRFVTTLDPGDFINDWASWNGKALLVLHYPDCALWSSDGTPEDTREILPLAPSLGCPTGLTPFGSRFLFVARVKNGRRPLTRIFLSDGTSEGTRRLAEVEGSAFGSQSVQAGGAVYLNLVFFNPETGNELSSQLWRTDGTVEGTRPASALSRPSDLYVFGGALYLTAPLGPEFRDGRGLFRISSPGEPPVPLGRVMDTDVFYFYPPRIRFAPVGGRLVFTIPDPWPEDRLKLWATDGTPEGTRLLRAFLPLRADAFSFPDALVSSGGRVFFGANDGQHGRELWESDGTPEGTRMVKDLAPGGYSALPLPTGLAISNGFLFFAADDGKTGIEPWALRLSP